MTTQQNDDATPAPMNPNDTPGSDSSASSVQDQGSALQKLQLENADLLEQLKRERADFVNYRSRTREEWQDWYRKGKGEAVLALVPVLHNLSRAFSSMPESGRNEAWKQGIEQIIQLGDRQLASLRIELIATTGSVFDSTLHEAISKTDGPEGMIIHEIEPGYLLDGKPLSVAKVIIGNGTESTKSEPSEI